MHRYALRCLQALRAIDWRMHLSTLALLVIVVVAVNAWRTRDVPVQAPDFAGVLADGSHITLAQFRALHPGQPVALHVWADWCPVCRTEQHSISRLLRSELPVLTVAMQSGDAAAVTATLQQRNLAWPAVVDEDGAIARRLHLPGVPAFVVIAADGSISSAELGYTSEIGMRLRLWLAGRGR